MKLRITVRIPGQDPKVFYKKPLSKKTMQDRVVETTARRAGRKSVKVADLPSYDRRPHVIRAPAQGEFVIRADHHEIQMGQQIYHGGRIGVALQDGRPGETVNCRCISEAPPVRRPVRPPRGIRIDGVTVDGGSTPPAITGHVVVFSMQQLEAMVNPDLNETLRRAGFNMDREIRRREFDMNGERMIEYFQSDRVPCEPMLEEPPF